MESQFTTDGINWLETPTKLYYKKVQEMNVVKIVTKLSQYIDRCSIWYKWAKIGNIINMVWYKVQATSVAPRLAKNCITCRNSYSLRFESIIFKIQHGIIENMTCKERKSVHMMCRYWSNEKAEIKITYGDYHVILWMMQLLKNREHERFK